MIRDFEDWTINITSEEKQISAFIGKAIRQYYVGKKNAVSSTRIIQGYQKSKGVKLSSRRIRKMVNYLRSQGVPIAASGDGYYYPATSDELYAYQQTLMQRITEMLRIYNALGKAGLPKFQPLTLNFKNSES